MWTEEDGARGDVARRGVQRDSEANVTEGLRCTSNRRFIYIRYGKARPIVLATRYDTLERDNETILRSRT
jgi:hypothetical protein